MARMPRAALLAIARRAKITEAAAKRMRFAKKASSKNLGHNLRQAGRHPYPARTRSGKVTDDAAHIVPKAAKYRSADLCQKILKKYDIHLDEPINGSWLPRGRDASKYPNPTGKSPHHATHRRKYYDALYKLLSRCRTEQEVVDTLNWVRSQLDKGIWP
jgi:hypothetical protein